MLAGVNGVMVAQMVTWALSTFAPSGYLAKALANWKSAAQRELERRGQWHPEAPSAKYVETCAGLVIRQRSC
jgi:hypothetical protein